MPYECAFCPATAKLSGEHLWSNWTHSIFKGKNFTFIQRDSEGEPISIWRSQAVNLRAKVVCKPCNEGWMSNLEFRHAKPALSDLIAGNEITPITQSRADSVAIFAFKTAVVIDHMRRDTPFFRRSIRHKFARTLTIPDNVQMWLAGFLPMGSGRFRTYYSNSPNSVGARIKLYVCSYSVGHFIFQVVAARSIGIPSFRPRPGFEHLAIPFWPKIPMGISWPPQDVLRTRIDFDKFSERWGAITFVLP